MKTKKVLTSVLLCTAVITVGILLFFLRPGPEPLEPSPFCGTVTDRVSVRFREGEGLRNGWLDLTITNHSDEVFIGKREFFVEVWEDGAWYSLPYVVEDPRFPEDGYWIDPFSSGNEIFPVSTYYGELAPGRYRLISADCRYCAPNAELFLPENHFFVFEFTV